MPTLAINYAQTSARVRETLQKAFGPNAAIRTDEGNDGCIYVRLVSDHFDGLGERAKQDIIWDTLRQELHEESDNVALVLAFGTDQI